MLWQMSWGWVSSCFYHTSKNVFSKLSPGTGRQLYHKQMLNALITSFALLLNIKYLLILIN